MPESNISHLEKWLTRLENKMDIVSQGIMKLVQVEERVAGVIQQNAQLQKAAQDMKIDFESRIRNLETAAPTNNRTAAFMDKVIYTILGVAGTVITALLMGGNSFGH